MEYAQEFDIATFEFWSGARSRVDSLRDVPGGLEALGEFIENLFDEWDKIPTETEINDLVWFELGAWLVDGDHIVIGLECDDDFVEEHETCERIF